MGLHRVPPKYEAHEIWLGFTMQTSAEVLAALPASGYLPASTKGL
jgi:hypothetical protein